MTTNSATTTAAKTTTGTVVRSYLSLNGRCEEALAFYAKAIGAKVEMVLRFDESPEPMPAGMLPPGFEKKVMHSEFRVGDTVIMASDGCGHGAPLSGFSLAIIMPTEDAVNRSFAALAEGGQVTMPLARTFWSPRYGMVTDKFGVAWMLMVPGE